MNPQGLLFVGIGAFSLCGAVFDWDWFINSRKAHFFVAVLGRAGARLLYGALGTGLVAFGILFALGFIKGAS
jgi:hypothetical protein